MAFELTEQQKMVRQMLRSWCEDKLEPRLDALEEGTELPYPLMRDLAKTFGIKDMIRSGGASEDGSDESAASSDSGGGLFGPGTDPMLGHIIMMELSRISPGFALSLGASIGLTGGTIMAKGDKTQKKRWGIPLLTLEKIGGWGLTEPNAGSDAFGSMRTTAKNDGDDWVINGSKTFITNAPHADIVVVYARLGELGSKHTGAFVLDTDIDGLTLGEPMKKMGMMDSPTGEIFLEDVRVTGEHLLGGRPEDSSRDQAKDTLKGERSAMPAMAAGMVQRCLEICNKYVREREQFGRPIGDFQAVQIRIAKIYTIQETIMNWVHRLAHEEANGGPSVATASAAKLYCGQACVDACLEAIQVLGGYGYMREGRVEKLMRDAKLFQIGGGTDDIQMIRIAAELAKKV
ncbi:MAG: acyl-CoA dehydrogenase family protein [Myxococcota bacterium]